MLDSPEDVCAGQARFEYPATSVLFSKSARRPLSRPAAQRRKEPSTRSLPHQDCPLLTRADRGSLAPNVPQRSIRSR